MAEKLLTIGEVAQYLKMPEEAVIAAIIRRGQIVIPRGVTEFEVGDEVLAVVNPQAAVDLAALFARHTSDSAPKN